MKLSLLKGTLVCVSVALAAVLWPTDADARSLTPDEAQKRAVAAMRQSSNAKGMYKAPGVGVATSSLNLVYTSANVGADKVPAFYVFNYPASRSGEGEGFVIATADDRLRPVLGMATEGSFDASNIPSNVAWWLGEYEREIAAFLDSPAASLASPVSSATGIVSRSTLDNYAQWAEIPTLITTTWNQDEPYNYDAPTYRGSRCVTGCVATAMAQIVNYYRITPPVGNGVKSYTTRSASITVEYDFDLVNPRYDWDNMLDSYRKNNYSADEASAVADLMKACGVSVEMDYTPGASAANSYIVPDALVKYFGFDKSTSHNARTDFDTADWEKLIYGELSNRRPLYYHGSSNKGGHAFICDGYLKDGLFHFNWGWGGYCDGYYALSALNTEGQGIGGFEGGYNMYQGVTVCIPPDAENKPESSDSSVYPYCMQSADFRFNSTESNTDSFILGVSLFSLQDNIVINPAICFDNAEGDKICLRSDMELNPYENYPNLAFSINDINLTPGVYHVYPMLSLKQEDGDYLFLKIQKQDQPYITELLLTVDKTGQRKYDIVKSQIEVIEFEQLNDFYNDESDNTICFTLFNSGNREFNNVVAYYLNGKNVGEIGLIIPAGESKKVKASFSVNELLTGECELSLYEQEEFDYDSYEYNYKELAGKKLNAIMNDGRRPGNDPVASTYGEFAFNQVDFMPGDDVVVPIIIKSTDGTSSISCAFRVYRHGTDEIVWNSGSLRLSVSSLWNITLGQLLLGANVGLYDLVAYDSDSGEEITKRVTLSFGGEANGLVYYPLLDGSGARVDAYTGSDENIIVPNEINGVTVKEIGDEFLKSNKKVKILELPGTLTAIGTDALRFTTNLESLFIDTPEALPVGHPSTVMYGTNPGLEIYVPESAFDGYQGTVLSDTYKIYKRITALSADKDEVEMSVDEEAVVRLVTTPSSDVNPDYDCSISNERVVSAMIDKGTITITGKSAGVAKVTLTSMQPGVEPVVIDITVAGPVDPVFDLNDDGKVNVFDLTVLVDLIVSDTAEVNRHDLNGDGQVNVFDLTELVNYIVGTPQSQNLSARSGHTLRELPLELGYDGAYIAMQTDLRVSGEGKVRSVSLNPLVSDSHTVSFGEVVPGVVRIMVYSFGNTPIELPDGEELLTLGIDGSAEISCEDAMFVTVGRTIYHVIPTGVQRVDSDSEVVGIDYYDMSGRRLSRQPDGICIRRVRYADGSFTTDKVLR